MQNKYPVRVKVWQESGQESCILYPYSIVDLVLLEVYKYYVLAPWLRHINVWDTRGSLDARQSNIKTID